MSPGIWSNIDSFRRQKGVLSFDVYAEEKGMRWWIVEIQTHHLPGPPAGYEGAKITIDCIEPGQGLDRSATEVLKSYETDSNTVSRQLSCPLGPVVQVDKSHLNDAYDPNTDSRTTYIFAGADSGAPNYTIKVSCEATAKTKREMFDAVDYIVSHLKFVDVNSQTE